jgi:hypothetical protein
MSIFRIVIIASNARFAAALRGRLFCLLLLVSLVSH